MSLKRLVSVLLCIAMMLCMSVSAVADDTPENGVVKIYLWGEPSEDELAAIKYTEETYKIKVDWRVVAWGSLDVTVLQDIQVGDAPDLITMHAENFPRVAIQKLVTPVSELDQELYNNPVLSEAATAPRANFSYAGNQYAVGGYGTPTFIFYNKTMFEDYGMETPVELWEKGEWNWETFRQCAIDMMDYDEEGNPIVYGFASWIYDMWVLANGGTFVEYTDENILLTLDDAATVTALQFLQDGYFKDKYIKPDGNVTHTTDFVSGKVAMIADGLYRALDFGEMKDEWDFVPVPAGPDNQDGSFPGSANGWAICSSAKNPRGAMLYLIGRAEYDAMTRDQLSGVYALLSEEQLARARSMEEGDLANHMTVSGFAGIGNIANKQWDWWAAIFNGTPIATANETIRPVFQAEIDAAIADTKMAVKRDFSELPVITFEDETATFIMDKTPDGSTWGTAGVEVIDDGIEGKSLLVKRDSSNEWQFMFATNPDLYFFPSYGHTYQISFDYKMLTDMGEGGYLYLCLRPAANIADGGVNFGWNTSAQLKAGDSGHFETTIGVDKDSEPLCLVFGAFLNGDIVIDNILVTEVK